MGIGRAGYGITKALGSIKPSEPSKSPKNADEKRNKANANPTGVNRLTVASCENVYLRRNGQVLVGRWSVDPMDADIVMSPEYDGGDVDCNVEACYPCWRWLSCLGRSRNANGGLTNVEVRPRPKRKAVTFALDWDERYEATLCPRCRDRMQKHYHGELCGRCGAIFTINRPWSLPELKIHHGVAHGTSSAVFEKRLTRSEST